MVSVLTLTAYLLIFLSWGFCFSWDGTDVRVLFKLNSKYINYNFFKSNKCVKLMTSWRNPQGCCAKTYWSVLVSLFGQSYSCDVSQRTFEHSIYSKVWTCAELSVQLTSVQESYHSFSKIGTWLNIVTWRQYYSDFQSNCEVAIVTFIQMTGRSLTAPYRVLWKQRFGGCI